jgi:hypothetical protein
MASIQTLGTIQFWAQQLKAQRRLYINMYDRAIPRRKLYFSPKIRIKKEGYLPSWDIFLHGR